jgi:hypothetical protein
MADDEQPAPKRYAYKPSVAGSPQVFTLTADGLAFEGGFRSAVFRYGDIARIRLSYRPVSMLAHRFRADIHHKDGRKLTVISATWAGLVVLTPQNDSYRAFIEELHRRVATGGGDVECLAGLPRFSFALAAAAFAAVIIALAGLLVRALVSSQFIAALFILGFGALFAWHTGTMLVRNKPRLYEPDNPPRQLLP